MSKVSIISKQVEEVQPTIQQSSFGAENIISSSEVNAFPNDGLVQFYTGQDCAKLLPSDMKKVRDLQESNDQLQRQIVQLDRDVKHSTDALSLLAERERLQIIIARNTGEILKIHTENEQRLARITELEEENIRLKEEVVIHRDSFIEIHDMGARHQHAANFFIKKSKMEKNIAELFDLSRE